MTHAERAGLAYIEQAITDFWGERCDVSDADCPTCQAWSAFDALSTLKPSGDAGEVVERLAEHLQLRYMTPSKITGETYQMVPPDLIEEVADLITTLERQLATAREALEPFAEALELIDHGGDNMPAGAWVTHSQHERDILPRVKHFRAAFRALTPGVSDAE